MNAWRWIFHLVWVVVGMTHGLPACAQTSTAAMTPATTAISPDADAAYGVDPARVPIPLDDAAAQGGTDGGLTEPSLAVGAHPPGHAGHALQTWRRHPHDPASKGPFLEGPLRPPRTRS